MSLNPSRPSSSELVELHVFYVPEGSWNYKLNTISIEVVNKFISAGFIRVSPHLTLQALRERLSEFLDEDAVAEKFLFLKCIGNNLAVVKAKQESELKLKSFAPPYVCNGTFKTCAYFLTYWLTFLTCWFLNYKLIILNFLCILGSSTRIVFASYNGSFRKYLFSINRFFR